MSADQEPPNPTSATAASELPWWGAGAMWTTGILGLGGVLGYRASLKENEVVAVNKVMERWGTAGAKPHPFFRPPPGSKHAAAPPTMVHFAARTLGIATALCLGTTAAAAGAVALALGVRSPDDARRKLDELKGWAPGLRQRCLASLGVKESEAQRQAEAELREVANLPAEEQFAVLVEKYDKTKSPSSENTSVGAAVPLPQTPTTPISPPLLPPRDSAAMQHAKKVPAGDAGGPPAGRANDGGGGATATTRGWFSSWRQ